MMPARRTASSVVSVSVGIQESSRGMGAADEGCASGIQERVGTIGLTVSVQVRVAGGHAQT